MLFNTFEFLVFFVVVYGLYLVLPFRAQSFMLLIASYVFYGAWDVRFLGLLMFTTAVDYAAARFVEGSSGGRRRLGLVISLGTNLALLGYFKYAGFFVDSALAVLGRLGVDAQPWRLDIVLPVGISFYTFQSMSYVIDVYRGQIPASRNLFDFALFVSFFPQLVAGPIERASHLLGQVTNPRRIDAAELRDGLLLIAAGLFKKMFIADNCALIVNRTFGAQIPPTGAEWLLAVYAFAFQIYGDFSGYSDMARGLAKMMGFELMVNFRLPYFATSPSDFWHRWHISLSTWLRDYLYIPLGGNRKGEARTRMNLLTTMLLGGLWHGAKWTMIGWGAYHGILLVAERMLRRAGLTLALPRPLAVILMFHLTCLGWLLFRADSIAQVGQALAAITTGWRWDEAASRTALRLALLAGPLLVVQLFQATRGELLLYARMSPAARTALVAGLGIVAFLHWTLFAQGFRGGEEFIYFQF